MMKQKKEVSDKVIIVLLVLAILFSVGGSILIYESVQSLRGGLDTSNSFSASTGFVSLEVADNMKNRGEIDESLQ